MKVKLNYQGKDIEYLDVDYVVYVNGTIRIFYDNGLKSEIYQVIEDIGRMIIL